MSVSYDIFINTSYTLSETKACLEGILNTSMEQSSHVDYEFYYLRMLDLGINLFGDLTYEGNFDYQNIELPISRYAYEISIDYIPSSYLRNYRHDWVILFLTVVADMISMNLHCECIVVRNVNTVLDRFLPGEQIFMPSLDSENNTIN